MAFSGLRNQRKVVSGRLEGEKQRRRTGDKTSMTGREEGVGS